MAMTVEEKKAKMKIYREKYNKENKEKIKAGKAKYYAENKEKVKLDSENYRKANKEKYNLARRNWVLKNKEKSLLSKRRYRESNRDKLKVASARYYAENTEKAKKACANYYSNNVEKYSAWDSNRRAKKFKATIYMTKEDSAKITELYEIARNATKLFGYGWEVDHIVPLNKGGLHKLSNLQVVPATWNRSKGDRNCDTYWD